MTTYTIGQNCQITLQHNSVNGGQPYGYLLTGEDKNYGAAVSVQHEQAADLTTKIRIFFCILLADNLTNPDGTLHSDSRSQMYQMLLNFLNQSSGLTIMTSDVVFAGVGASGFSATETHYEALTLVTCQFNNTGAYYPSPTRVITCSPFGTARSPGPPASGADVTRCAPLGLQSPGRHCEPDFWRSNLQTAQSPLVGRKDFNDLSASCIPEGPRSGP